ncbi:hypothetical protein QSU96_07700 [Vibrio furnissii]|uniref:hypothetical protein n=1 Tax=Vibrio furnissii TaxID=29494 RepID=UPI0025730E40|nr:hypothetical protein [Vibrio furnissii]WJG27587.1 hypothetical protein QSU96_07700 [Vibrio furnissii]
MKKLFFLLCITAAVLIAGRAHAAYKVSSKGVFTQGCRGPVVYGGIYSSFDQFKGQTFSNCTTKISKVSQGSETHVAFFGDYHQIYAQFQLVAAECPKGTVPDNQTGACVDAPDEPTRCEILRDRGEVVEMYWSEAVYGGSFTGGYYCTSYGCVSQVTKSIGCNSGNCFGDATLTGDECSGSGNSSACTDSTCSTKLEGKDPDPNDPTPEPGYENPIHDPDDPTSSVDAGGNVSNPDVTLSTPEDVDPVPEVTTPESGEATDAIVNLNKNVNKALNDLNIDINKSNSKIENELKLLNSSNEGIKSQLSQLEETNIKLADNNKALLTNLNRDITTAVNVNTKAVNKLGGKVDGLADKVGDLNESVDGMASDVGEIKDSVAGLGDSLDGLSEDLSGIGDAIDEFATVDLRSARDGTCVYNQTGVPCQGYYEPKYPLGFDGIVTEHFETLKEELGGVVDGIFGGLDLSNANSPQFCMEVMQFGTFCFTDYFDLNWVFTFVRACMMFGTIMLSRRLVFGG